MAADLGLVWGGSATSVGTAGPQYVTGIAWNFAQKSALKTRLKFWRARRSQGSRAHLAPQPEWFKISLIPEP